MGIGNVEIKVRTSDAGESRVVKTLNADLKQTEALGNKAGHGVAGIGKGLLSGAEGVDKVKGKFAMLTGIIPGIGGGIAAIGASVALVTELFGGLTSGAQDSIATLDAFGKVLEGNSARAKALGSEIQAIFDRARDARVEMLRLSGANEEADRLSREKGLDAYVKSVTEAQRKLGEVNSQILWVGGAQQAASIARGALNEIIAEQDAYWRNAVGSKTLDRRGVQDFLSDDQKEARNKAEAAATQADLTLGNLQKDKLKIQTAITTLKAGPELQATIAIQQAYSGILTLSKDALKTQLSTASAYSALLKDQGAGKKEIAKALEAEWKLKKLITQSEIRGSLASLEAEDKKLQSLIAQFSLMGQIDRLTVAYNARRDIAATRTSLNSYSGAYNASTYQPPKAGGGAGKAAPKRSVQAYAGWDVDPVVLHRRALDAANKSGPDKDAALAERTAAALDAATERLQRVREDLLAAAEQAKANSDQLANDAVGEKDKGRQRELLDAAREQASVEAKARQDALTALVDFQITKTGIEREAEAERAAIQAEALDRQLAAVTTLTSSSLSAWDALQKHSTGGEVFASALRGTQQLAAAYKDLVDGKAGAISAIAEKTFASIKSEKTRAGLMAGVALAEAGLALGRGQYVDAGVLTANAGMWALLAGSSSGGSKGTAATRRAPSVRSAPISNGGAIVMNFYAPVLGAGGYQALGREVQQATGSLAGTGM